jgi:CPA2 family monovalent cation:H+ antiporter-2
MRDVLADTRGDLEDLRHSARASLNEDLGNWNVAAREVQLPAGATVAGRTLAELALPARFGSAVIEVERNGQLIRDVGGAFALFPGDRVLLAGEHERAEEARAFLEQRQTEAVQDEDFGRVVLDTSLVSDAQIGRSVSELHLAAVSGVRVVGIQRGGFRIISPGSDERLQAGDELLLLGTLEALQRFQRGLPPRVVPDERPQIAPRAHPTHA